MNKSTTVSGSTVRALITITLVCGSIMPRVFAEETDQPGRSSTETVSTDAQNAVADESSDTGETGGGPRHWGVVPLPLIAYTPDTGGMFGGAAIFFYGPDVGLSENEKTGRRNNTAAVNAIITTNGSYIGSLSGTNYLADERYRWD
ncbi:MAG TPA: hypothetical protein VJ904_06980, partial [Tichowtungia sp.]|nr:hypothetical protein [Tichowtungia sp.]